MSRPLRVVIADDHPFYRDGLVRSLRDSGIDVVREVPNAEAAIQAVAETAPDLLVMDLNMPGMSGVEATRQMAERFPSTPVLMLSVSAEEEDIVGAMSAGAVGYVLKESPQEQIVAAIRAAASGPQGRTAQARMSPAAARPAAHGGRRMRARPDMASSPWHPRRRRVTRPPPEGES
jgi:DNA-binding NarL/FixJ family response regulator